VRVLLSACCRWAVEVKSEPNKGVFGEGFSPGLSVLLLPTVKVFKMASPSKLFGRTSLEELKLESGKSPAKYTLI